MEIFCKSQLYIIQTLAQLWEEGRDTSDLQMILQNLVSLFNVICSPSTNLYLSSKKDSKTGHLNFILLPVLCWKASEVGKTCALLTLRCPLFLTQNFFPLNLILLKEDLAKIPQSFQCKLFVEVCHVVR